MSPVDIGIARDGPTSDSVVYCWLGKSYSVSLDTFCPRVT